MIDKITDKTLEDFERIEVMKSQLAASENDLPLQEIIKKALVQILNDKNDDELVRQHAAIELSFYNPEITDEIVQILKNTNEDIDLRINLLELIKDKDILKDISKQDELYEYL